MCYSLFDFSFVHLNKRANENQKQMVRDNGSQGIETTGKASGMDPKWKRAQMAAVEMSRTATVVSLYAPGKLGAVAASLGKKKKKSKSCVLRGKRCPFSVLRCGALHS